MPIGNEFKWPLKEGGGDNFESFLKYAAEEKYDRGGWGLVCKAAKHLIICAKYLHAKVKNCGG